MTKLMMDYVSSVVESDLFHTNTEIRQVLWVALWQISILSIIIIIITNTFPIQVGTVQRCI